MDPAKVFVFAHSSLGPVVGSLAVAREVVRGFIAVETIGASWFEYDLERVRLQVALSGKKPDLVDREPRDWAGKQACRMEGIKDLLLVLFADALTYQIWPLKPQRVVCGAVRRM